MNCTSAIAKGYVCEAGKIKIKFWNKALYRNFYLIYFFYLDRLSLFQLNTAQLINLFTQNIDMSNCLLNCSSNGFCKNSASGNALVCDCNQYFVGPACQIDLRPCSSNPCLNNGTCVQNITDISNPTYFCECDKYYEGSVCQNKIDLCQNQTCSKQGNCIEVNNEPVCSCHYLFEGSNCESESQTLKTVKSLISTASVIAILTIVFFYSLIIASDVLNIFIKKNRREEKNKEEELFKNAIEEFLKWTNFLPTK